MRRWRGRQRQRMSLHRLQRRGWSCCRDATPSPLCLQCEGYNILLAGKPAALRLVA